MQGFPLQTFLRNARAVEKLISLALVEPALSLSQYRMLAEFLERDTLTVSELSIRLNIAKPSVTSLIKQLQTMKLINIQPDPDDQRSKRLTLTRDGKLRLKIANEYLAALEKRLAKNCSAEQLSALRNLEIKTPR
ncbi:MAG: hypothetical protein BMS9Abin33_1316 [Gammaproteobacteria bacterium]|nr:MAG: hypothetical protein BMS9Abin33_1316 [Gammaproteobacteria bacterium]